MTSYSQALPTLPGIAWIITHQPGLPLAVEEPPSRINEKSAESATLFHAPEGDGCTVNNRQAAQGGRPEKEKGLCPGEGVGATPGLMCNSKNRGDHATPGTRSGSFIPLLTLQGRQSILRKRKLRLREAKRMAPSHPTGKAELRIKPLSL